MRNYALAKIAEALKSETGGQTVKSAIGVLFFIVFVASGIFINSASLPLSYNIAFGDSGNGSGSGGGGGGGGGGGYDAKTKARIDVVRVAIAYEDAQGRHLAKNEGAAIANDPAVGWVGWYVPENVMREDRERATAEIAPNQISYYIRLTNLGTKIPVNAKIRGVVAEIKKSADGPQAIRDYSVKLVKGGVIQGTNHADMSAWAANDTWDTYGGETDLWGLALTSEDVNARGFGIVIAAQNGNAAPRVEMSQPEETPKDLISAVKKNEEAPQVEMSQPEETLESLIATAKKNKEKSVVLKMQNALVRANKGPAARKLAIAGPNGIYGPATKAAIAEYEKIAKKAAPDKAPTIAPMPVPRFIEALSRPETTATAIAPMPIINIKTAPQPAPVVEDRAGMIQTLLSLPTPLGRGDSGEEVRILQNLLIAMNIGPDARELKRRGATGKYEWPTERAVAEMQNSLMKNPLGPAGRKLIEAFDKYHFGKGTFGEATQAAEIEYLTRSLP